MFKTIKKKIKNSIRESHEDLIIFEDSFSKICVSIILGCKYISFGIIYFISSILDILVNNALCGNGKIITNDKSKDN